MFQTDFEKEIESFYRSVYRSMIDMDMDLLGDVLTEDFMFTGIDASELDKNDFTNAIEQGAIKIYSENIERVYIEEVGDVLNVRGRSKVNVSIDGERRRIRRVQVDLCLQKVEGSDDPANTKWKILSAKATYY